MSGAFATLLGLLAGGGPASDTKTITSGGSGTTVGFLTGSYGSLSNTAFNLKSGTPAIRQITADTTTPDGFNYTVTVTLQLAGTQTNADFSTMTCGVVSHSRALATFSTAGGNSTWTWQYSTTGSPQAHGVPLSGNSGSVVFAP